MLLFYHTTSKENSPLFVTRLSLIPLLRSNLSQIEVLNLEKLLLITKNEILDHMLNLTIQGVIR